MAPDALHGKKILILGGSPQEQIDPARHYANAARPEDHGARVAATLTQAGADVTLIAPPRSANAQDLLAATAQAAGGHYDAVLQLANISAVTPAVRSEQKLKSKKGTGAPVTMEVLGNIDIRPRLRQLFPHTPLLGYDKKQRWFSSEDSSLARTLATIAQPIPTSEPLKLLPAPQAPLGRLAGRHIIVNSGPTAEAISDSGDVITNFSSGRQGHAVAQALAKMGARVTLVSGPAWEAAPVQSNIRTIFATSPKAMLAECLKALPADGFVGVAAVADYGMDNPPSLDLKEGEPHTITLSQNPDILETMGKHPAQRPVVVVGFAAESQDVVAYARGKLGKKNADLICANAIGDAAGTHANKVTFVTPEGDEPAISDSKEAVGQAIAERIVLLLHKNKAVTPAASYGR